VQTPPGLVIAGDSPADALKKGAGTQWKHGPGYPANTGTIQWPGRGAVR